MGPSGPSTTQASFFTNAAPSWHVRGPVMYGSWLLRCLKPIVLAAPWRVWARAEGQRARMHTDTQDMGPKSACVEVALFRALCTTISEQTCLHRGWRKARVVRRVQGAALPRGGEQVLTARSRLSMRRSSCLIRISILLNLPGRKRRTYCGTQTREAPGVSMGVFKAQ